MFNRRSFLALLGLAPLAVVKPKAQGTIVCQHLAITEALAPGATRLSRPPLPGTLSINVLDLLVLDDADGNLRGFPPEPGMGSVRLTDRAVMGQINYTTGVLELWTVQAPAMARYQALA